MIRVLIAEDQALIRQSLKIILESVEDIEVVGTAENGNEAIQLARQEKPDVILMDIRMPELDGVRCTQILKEEMAEVRIIVLTTFDDDEYVFNALKYGASGYLLKGVSMEDLIAAVRTAMQGGSMIAPTVAAKVLRLFARMAQNEFQIEVQEKGVNDLTRTEWKVIGQVGCGLSNREIASKLGLSEGTVRNYLSTILGKLELRDRTQLAIWAVQTGANGGTGH